MQGISQIEGPYVLIQGKKWLDFSSCDFLGLSQHPEMKKMSIKYVLKYGVGVPPFSLKSASQQQLEEKLAQCLGAEVAFLFPSFKELHLILKKHQITLVSADTEDDLEEKKWSDRVVVDESFTVGIMGYHGMGILAHSKSREHCIVGSLNFGVGCQGAYIAGSRSLLVDLPLFPSQAMSFASLGSLDSALNLIPEMDSERETVTKNHKWLQKQFSWAPFKGLKSPRVMFPFDSEKEAEDFRQFFIENQIFLAPPQNNLLYFSTTALHTPDDLDQLALVLKKLSTAPLALSILFCESTPS